MVAAAVAGAAVVGSAMQADAAGDAAKKQANASRDATAAQQDAAAQMRQDLSPWTNQGVAANNALGYYLGINPGGGTGLGSSGGSSAPAQTYDQIRQELLKQYTTTQGGSDPRLTRNWSQQDIENAGLTARELQDLNTGNGEYLYTGRDASTTVDEARLEADIQSRLRAQSDAQAQQQSALSSAQGDSRYGSLLTPYRNGEEFSFTGKDLASDPGYKFGLDQGLQGIDRAQASRGNFLSGAAIKEATRYNEDYAGTKFNDAFNRASSTWQTNLGAYNGNRDRIYNFLNGVSTLGQNSAAQVGASDQRAAGSTADNINAAGNALAAGSVASGNAWSSGLNTAANAFNTRGASSNGLSGYDYGANGQSNPLNQSNFDAAIMRYQG